MNKFILALGIAVTGGFPLLAQPTLTSSMMNPVPVEVFDGHQCDPTIVTPGASGASVTWNFSTLSVTGLDTTTWLACDPTVHCDSFTGSNMVMYDGTDFFYCNADTTKIAIIGAETAGTFLHLQGEQMLLYYPLTYGSVRLDSFKFVYPFFESYRETDSFICDGYGTLILPSGTYSNVMRVHQIAYVWDTTSTSGASAYRTENYNWYSSGFHFQMLTISVDTSMPGGPYTSNAEYYTQGVPLSIPTTSKPMTVEMYPNPASSVVHVQFYMADNSEGSVTLSDVTGRTLYSAGGDRIQRGYNELDVPVSGLAAGMYIVRVSDGRESMNKKVFVGR